MSELLEYCSLLLERRDLHSAGCRLLHWQVVLKDLWNQLQGCDEDLVVHYGMSVCRYILRHGWN